MRYHLHQPRRGAQSQELESKSRHALILRDLGRNALIQEAGRIGLNGEVRRKVTGRRICRRLCRRHGWSGHRSLRCREERKNGKKTNDLHAEVMKALKNEG